MIRKKLVILGLVGAMAMSTAINNVTVVKAETLRTKDNVSTSSFKNSSDENKELDKVKRKAKNHAENLLAMANNLNAKGNYASTVEALIHSAKEKVHTLNTLGEDTTKFTDELNQLEKNINKTVKKEKVNETLNVKNKSIDKSKARINETLNKAKDCVDRNELAELDSLILLATHLIGKIEKDFSIDVNEFKTELFNITSAKNKLYWKLNKENSDLKDEIYNDINKIDELLNNEDLDKCKELYENIKKKVNNFKYEDITHAKDYVPKIKNKLKAKKQLIYRLEKNLAKIVVPQKEVVDPIKEKAEVKNKVVVPVKEAVIAENKVVAEVKEIIEVKDEILAPIEVVVPVKEKAEVKNKVVVPVEEANISENKVKEVAIPKIKVIVPNKRIAISKVKVMAPIKEIAKSNEAIKEYKNYDEINNLVKDIAPIKDEIKAIEKKENVKNELVAKKESSIKEMNNIATKKVAKINKTKAMETKISTSENNKVEEIKSNSDVKKEENKLDNNKIENNNIKTEEVKENKEKSQPIKNEKSFISKGLIGGVVATIVAIGAGVVLFLRKKF